MEVFRKAIASRCSRFAASVKAPACASSLAVSEKKKARG
jgi:hypothetical protein